LESRTTQIVARELDLFLQESDVEDVLRGTLRKQIAPAWHFASMEKDVTPQTLILETASPMLWQSFRESPSLAKGEKFRRAGLKSAARIGSQER
jgi:hypothetical protein